MRNRRVMPADNGGFGPIVSLLRVLNLTP